MRLGRISLVFLAAALLVLGCHSSSPTSTTGFQVTITATLQNTALAATITDAQLYIDGTLAQDLTSPTPIISATLVASGGIAAGAHTLTVVIATQTTASNNYTVPTPDIQEFDANGNFIKDIRLQTQSATLTSGQGLAFPFSL